MARSVPTAHGCCPQPKDCSVEHVLCHKLRRPTAETLPTACELTAQTFFTGRGPSPCSWSLPTPGRPALGCTVSPQDADLPPSTRTCPSEGTLTPEPEDLPHGTQMKPRAQRLSPQHPDKLPTRLRDTIARLTAPTAPRDARDCATTHGLFLQCSSSLHNKYSYHTTPTLASRCARLPRVWAFTGHAHLPDKACRVPPSTYVPHVP